MELIALPVILLTGFLIALMLFLSVKRESPFIPDPPPPFEYRGPVDPVLENKRVRSGQFWLQTDTNNEWIFLKYRNETNTDWEIVFTVEPRHLSVKGAA